MRPDIEIHIEELVLRGFPYGHRYRIAGAIERELARLFAGGSLPSSLSQDTEMGDVDGGAFDATGAGRPETVGVRTARAVFKGLSR